MTEKLNLDARRLVEAWDGANRERFLELLATGPGIAEPGGHLTASALIVDSAGERVLLCLHGRIGKWVQLGGHLEAGDEDLAAAALREATEESGIHGLRIDPEPIDFDVHPVNCRYGPSNHFDVRFVVYAPADAVERVSSESKALGWFRPDALPEPLADATERLVGPALARYRSLSA